MPKHVATILVIEDDAVQCELLKRLITRVFSPIGVSGICASSMAIGIERANQFRPIMAVVDLNLGAASPPHDTLARCNELRCPFIAYTGVEDAALVEDAKAAGASDVILKSNTSDVGIIDKIGLLLESLMPKQGAGRVVYEQRHNRWPKLKHWFAQNGITLIICIFTLGTAAGGAIGTFVSRHTKTAMDEAESRRTVNAHTQQIKEVKQDVAGVKQQVVSLKTNLDGQLQSNQKEVLAVLADIGKDIATGKQERKDIKESLNVIRDDVRSNRPPSR